MAAPGPRWPTTLDAGRARARRIEKTAFVARSDVALSALRVCLFTGNESNCMRCEKCLRAAITLETLGVLERAAAFGTARLDLRRVASPSSATIVPVVDSIASVTGCVPHASIQLRSTLEGIRMRA